MPVNTDANMKQPVSRTKDDASQEQRIANLEALLSSTRKEVKGLQDTFIDINKSIQELTKAMAAKPAPVQATAKAKEPTNGLIKNPEGDFVLQNPFDLSAMIEIAVVPKEGYIPQVMQFPDPNDKSGNQLLSYNFRLDDKGRAHYFMPLMFAKSQLRNDGGLKFVLVSPAELPIDIKNANMQREQKIVKASPDYTPIFER